MQPAPLTEPLDAYLREVVATLQQAVSQGLRHVEDDPATVERSIHDCAEILDTVLEGHVQDWVAA